MVFTGAEKNILLKVSSGSDGGRVELRLDAVDGPLIGQGEITPNGSWSKFKELNVDIEPVTGMHTLFLVFRDMEGIKLAQIQLQKAESQLKIIDQTIAAATDAGNKYRIGLLRSRIAAERDHLLLNMYSTNRSMDINQMAGSWANNFTSRVTDISSLGNVVSMQNRFIHNNFMDLAWKKLNTYTAMPPGNLKVHGTKNRCADRMGARQYALPRLRCTARWRKNKYNDAYLRNPPV